MFFSASKIAGVAPFSYPQSKVKYKIFHPYPARSKHHIASALQSKRWQWGVFLPLEN